MMILFALNVVMPVLKLLAPFDGGTKNVCVESVVISELKFSHVQRQILGTHLVERSDDTTLEDAPKALNRLRVHRADNVLPLGVIDGRVWEFYAKSQIITLIRSLG